MMRMFLNAGADVYAFSYKGKTARQAAVQSSNVEIIQLLDQAEAAAARPEPRNPEIDLARIEKEDLCSICQAIPFELFDPNASHHRRYDFFEDWHPSLISLRDKTLEAVRFACSFGNR